MKDIQDETSPEDSMALGREVERFRASPQAMIARAFAGPLLLVTGLAIFVVQALARTPIAEPRGPIAALAVIGVLVGLRGARPFVMIVLLQLRVYEQGFVLRSGDGTRAVSWEAVQEIRTVRTPGGTVRVSVQLVHGEALEIAEDIGELRAVEERFRDAVGEKFCG